MNTPNSPLREKTMNFAIRIVRMYRYLADVKKEYVMSKQILRAGTSPGAMVREASNAESGSDFIHKLSVAQKEAGETLYWLELLWKTDYLSEKEFNSLYTDCQAILKMISRSILTKKKNLATKSKT